MFRPCQKTGPDFHRPLRHSSCASFPLTITPQVVLIVGNSNSGEDICREVASVAKAVHVCARAYAGVDPGPPAGTSSNIHR